MQGFEAIDQIFEEAGTPFAIVGSNGKVIRSSLSLNVIEELFSTLNNKIQSLELGVYLFKFPYVVFKVSNNCVLLMHTKIGKTAFTKLARQIMMEYGEVFDSLFAQMPMNVGDLVKSYLFAMNRINGPETIASYIPTSGTAMEMVDEFKLSMSALMVLANQTTAKARDVLTFQPLLETNELGIVYIFRIPLCEARGGAYDSAIMAIVNYEYRDIVYRYNDRLERVFKFISEDFKRVFQDACGDEVDVPIEDRKPFIKLIEQLHLMMEFITLRPSSADMLKESMVDAVTEFHHKFFSK